MGDPIQGEQVNLFDFLRVLAIASYRGAITRQQAAMATLVATDSDGISGTNVTVRVERISAEFDISESQIWRQFGALRDGGWFVQTAKPTRGVKGKPGRKARYRTTVPPLDLGLATLPDRADAEGNSEADRVASLTAEVRDESAGIVSQRSAEQVRDESADTPESSRTSDPNRLALSAESSRTAHAQRCDGPTSDGPTSDGPTNPVAGLGAQPQDARATTDTPPGSLDRQETTPAGSRSSDDPRRAYAAAAREAIRAAKTTAATDDTSPA